MHELKSRKEKKQTNSEIPITLEPWNINFTETKINSLTKYNQNDYNIHSWGGDMQGIRMLFEAAV